jgi:hypothetical protein
MTSTSHDLSHPPGYLQDARASFEERPIEPYQPFANLSESVSWAKQIGGKVIKVEEALWKRING